MPSLRADLIAALHQVAPELVFVRTARCPYCAWQASGTSHVAAAWVDHARIVHGLPVWTAEDVLARRSSC